MHATASRWMSRLCLAGSLLGAAAASATGPGRVDKQPAVAAPEARPAEAGMRAFLDPESGTLGVPPAQPLFAASDKTAPSSSEQPVQIVLPDGSVMMDLKGTCQEYVVMQLDANGRLSTRCVQDPAAAAALPNPTPQPQDR